MTKQSHNPAARRRPTDLVWRLLRRNISARQIAGYAIANVVGLSIVLIALQFYRDVKSPAADGAETFINRDYLIVSKEVSETGTLLGNSTTFSRAEISDLASQPWVKSIGEFTSSRFHVTGYADFGGRRMSTYLFFEAIPDRFFDRLPHGWGFNPADPSAEVPIVLSKDYLALYNFGFAASRGMPQISENLISRIPLRLSLSGNGRQQWITGRVVGFSSRLNTIAVPEQFMRWANSRFGDPDEKVEVSRLILEVSDPGSPAVTDYLRSHAIEIAGDKANQSRTSYFLSVLSAVVISIGIIISALSFFILTLSIMLLLQKNTSQIRNLLMLGYSINSVSGYYIRLVAGINLAILVISAAALLAGRSLWAAPFESLSLSSTSPLPTLATGLGVMALLTIANAIAIRRIVRRNFR